MGASLALAGADRLHAAAAREDRPVRPAARRDHSRQAAVIRDRDDARRRRARGCSSRATRDGRRRSRATPSIPAASAPPTSSRRRRSSISTIPTARARVTNLGEIRPVAGVPRRDARGARRASSRSRAPASGSSPNRSARRRSPRRSRSSSRAIPRRGGTSGIRPSRDNARAGARLAFGDVRRHAVPHRSQADVIVALDADFLACGPGSLRYARDVRVAAAARAAPIG